ncbi:MAG: YdcF family protein [Bryobacterales bacterium]|nr:YdcF family protein [Bryobacterales bacterium]
MRRFRFFLSTLFILLGAAVSHSIWLPWLGEFLVRADAPRPADAVIVLAGDYSGGRILKGAELVASGLAPLVLVSGPWQMYGRNEAHLAIDFITSKGFPNAWFRPLLHQSDSTRDEAAQLRDYLLTHGFRKVLVVTSDFHTRRAGAILRRAMPDIDIRMIAAASPDFRPQSWWTSRPSQKVFFQEWLKTLADWMNI